MLDDLAIEVGPVPLAGERGDCRERGERKTQGGQKGAEGPKERREPVTGG